MPEKFTVEQKEQMNRRNRLSLNRLQQQTLLNSAEGMEYLLHSSTDGRNVLLKAEGKVRVNHQGEMNTRRK